MSFLDRAKGLVTDNRDKIRQGIDMAEKQARKYVPAKHEAKVAKAVDMAHKGVDKVDGQPPVDGSAPPAGQPSDGRSSDAAEADDSPPGEAPATP